MKLKSLLLLGSFSAMVFSCSPEAKPEDSLKQFFNLVAKRNFDEVSKITTVASAKNLGELEEASKTDKIPEEKRLENAKNLTYGPAEIKGDSAFVKVTNGKKTTTQTYTLVKQDGKWLVDISPSSMKRINQK